MNRFLLAAAGAGCGGALAIGSVGLRHRKLEEVAWASDGLHATSYPWSHRRPWQAFDHASIRRGHKVFTEVCAQCHSIERIAFRNLVDVCYTEDEAKALAEEYTVMDGPDDKGNMFERPCKLSDYIPGPYRNEQHAREQNNGAYPPDLSLVAKARHGGADYLFALLTGYRAPPAGVQVPEGMHYNPYFPGGSIAMAQALGDEMVDYDGEAPETQTQYAKDVTTFLCWAAEPEMEERKRLGLKFMLMCGLMAVPALYYKRFKWGLLKHRQIRFKK